MFTVITVLAGSCISWSQMTIKSVHRHLLRKDGLGMFQVSLFSRHLTLVRNIHDAGAFHI